MADFVAIETGPMPKSLQSVAQHRPRETLTTKRIMTRNSSSVAS